MAAAPKSGYIIDSSAALALILPDERTLPIAEKMLAAIEGKALFAPKLLSYEVANGLRPAFLQKRIDQSSARILWRNFRQIPLQALPLSFPKIISLAISENISVYDATYLYLSKRHRLPLLSLDQRLSRLALNPSRSQL